MAKPNVYEIVTEQILRLLDKGTVPWRMPWKTDGGRHYSLTTGKAYRGINPMLLSCAGYACPYWLTFNQAKKLGVHVRKGEKSSIVVFWRWIEKKGEEVDDGTGQGTTASTETKRFPILRYYRVFNAEQVKVPDGMISKLMKSKTIPAWGVDQDEEKDLSSIETADAIVEGMPNRPTIRYEGDRAFYRPSTDTVTIPDKERFDTQEERYSTTFHELTHSTGHESRTGRVKDWSLFRKDHGYSQEELVAEMGAAFLCAEAGVSGVIESSASYIEHWRSKISKDSKLVVMAAAQAQKAVDFILERTVEKSAAA